jgi:carboxyvinyl-carboxyphosphonate phosphorylmutase
MAPAPATERRARLRRVLEGDACVQPASVFDPLSARAAQDLGFEVGMLAGSVASLAVLGAPDWTLITLTELSDLVSRICRAGDGLPLVVDADHGYGNALNVMRTVEELERAGAAALALEDTILPAAYGESGSRRLVSVDEGAAKLRAAVEARQDPELVLLGRTPGPGEVDVDDCLARIRAYQETGVDGLFVVGLGGLANLEALAKEARLPLMVAGVGAPADPARLAELGVRISLQPHLPIQAAARAAYEVLAALRRGTAPADLVDRIASAEQVAELTRQARFDQLRKDFLGS